MTRALAKAATDFDSPILPHLVQSTERILKASGTRTMPRDLILGTAGHIDHGKTSLVKALTGIDCDRLPEEKARGITIDIGFATLDLPSPSGRGAGGEGGDY